MHRRLGLSPSVFVLTIPMLARVPMSPNDATTVYVTIGGPKGGTRFRCDSEELFALLGWGEGPNPCCVVFTVDSASF